MEKVGEGVVWQTIVGQKAIHDEAPSIRLEGDSRGRVSLYTLATNRGSRGLCGPTVRGPLSQPFFLRL
jgi:hypothetical protein